MVGTTKPPIGYTATHTVSLRVDDQLIPDTVRVPVFSDWDKNSIVPVASVDLTPGLHVFRFGVDGWDYMDFQWSDFAR